MPSTWTDRFGVPAAPARALEAAFDALREPDGMSVSADAAHAAGGTAEDAEGRADGAEHTRQQVELLLAQVRDAGVPLDWLGEPHAAEALVRLAYAAPFLVRHLCAFPQRLALGVLARLEDGALLPWSRSAGAAGTFAALDETAALAALRHWKYDNYVKLTARSLLGLADTAATCAAVTRVAEGVTRAALAHAFAAQVVRQGLPVRADGRLAGLAIVGMGKLGGGELNYASDIDLILIHDGDDAECRPLPPDAAPPAVFMAASAPPAVFMAASAPPAVFMPASVPPAVFMPASVPPAAVTRSSVPPGQPGRRRTRARGEGPQEAGSQEEDPTADDAALWGRWQALADRAGPAGEHALANGEFFQRVGRQLIRLLSSKTDEGLCFRVDVDLRPQGRSGLLVPSLAFTARYYEEQGREWERTALIKARRVAGAPDVWAAFAAAVNPFVYRRYLDYSAMEGVALIKHDIDRHLAPERDGHLKLGHGGIREQEFLVQARQLLHGGRIPALQAPGHADAVRALVEARLLEPEEAASLLEDYWLLRAVENRVQMLDEAQEHTLPADPALRRRVLTDFRPRFAARQAPVEAALAQARTRTEERYQRLFARLVPGGVPQGSDWRATLRERLPAGEDEAAHAQVDALLNRLMRTRDGERCVFKAERLLTRQEPYRTGTEPAFPRWLAFLEQIGNRNALYALMEAHPESLAWASRIFAEGGRHAPPLIRHPEFLESFLTVRPDEPRLTSGAAMRERFRAILDHARDEEEFLLDLQTASAHARLHILSQYLVQDDAPGSNGGRAPQAPAGQATGPQSPAAQAAHHALLSDLAEAAVDVCARHAWRRLVPRFGLPQNEASRDAGEHPPGDADHSGVAASGAASSGSAAQSDLAVLSDAPELSGFAVLALGKLGSREMRFGSDLDLVFVYRGDGTTTKGRSHWEFYTKLAQKLTALLTAPTQFGVLLELDHRLRPFGGKGLLVPSLAGYESFLDREAEVWNFQSFTRARHLCGEPALSAAVLGRVARAWLLRRTPPQDVAREVFTMAQRLAAQSPVSAPDRIQLKYALGGMLGFEFLRQCHFLLGRQAGEAAGLDPNRADPAALAGWWTPPGDHEIINRLAPDYEALSALDERVAFYVEPYRHEVGPDTFRRYAGVGRRWSYEQVFTLCQRMRASLEGAFRHLSG